MSHRLSITYTLRIFIQNSSDSEDDGCRVLYGIVRDCAYKIRAQAECEREAHKIRGIWDVI